MQNSRKQPISYVESFPSISGNLLGLLHGCCTRPLSATRGLSPERPVAKLRFCDLMTEGGAEQVVLLRHFQPEIR